MKKPGKVRKTMQMISFSFMRSNISFFICLVVKEHIFKKEEKFLKNSEGFLVILQQNKDQNK